MTAPHSEQERVEPGQAAGERLPARVDVVIIGGGVIGLLSAIEMRKLGREVLLLDAGAVGAAQSSRNLGFLREQGREEVEARAMKYSMAYWAELASETRLPLGVTRRGHLSIARDESAMANVESWRGIAEEYEVPFELLGREEVSLRFPWLSEGSVVGAGFTERDAQVEPRLAVRAIADLAEQRGVTVLERTPADEIIIEGGRATGVRVGQSSVGAGLVLVAAGAWTSRLLAPAGIRLPVHLGRATVGLTKSVSRFTDASVWEVGGVGFRQSSTGGVVFGLGAFVDVDMHWEDMRSALSLLPLYLKNRRTMRLRPGRELWGDLAQVLRRRDLQPHSFDEPRVNSNDVEEGLRQLGALVPGMREAELEACWAGVIDSTPDFLPIIGDVGVGDLLVVAGTSGHGMGIAPALANSLAALSDLGEYEHGLGALSASRF